MSDRVRVLVYAAAPGGDIDAISRAYHTISRDLEGTPGLLGNELLRCVHDPDGFVVMSEWESLEAFRAWEGGAAHRDTTSPLRPYQDQRGGASFSVYEVAAAYEGRHEGGLVES